MDRLNKMKRLKMHSSGGFCVVNVCRHLSRRGHFKKSELSSLRSSYVNDSISPKFTRVFESLISPNWDSGALSPCILHSTPLLCFSRMFFLCIQSTYYWDTRKWKNKTKCPKRLKTTGPLWPIARRPRVARDARRRASLSACSLGVSLFFL